jgi:hypothetical protein
MISAGAENVEPTKPAKPPDANFIKNVVSLGDFPPER